MPETEHERRLSPEARSRLYHHYATMDTGIPSNAQDQADGRWSYFRKYLLPWMPGGKTDAIVDVGCGSGSLLRFLMEQGYKNLCGIDRSAEQVELARRTGLGSIVSEGDAVAFLRERPGQFDCICAVDFIEHLDRSEAIAFLEVGREALLPGGVLVIQTINGASPFCGNYVYGDLTHESTFTARSLSQAMRFTGFTDLHTRSIDPVPHGLKSAFRFAVWQIIKSVLIGCVVVETGMAHGIIVSQNLIAVGRK